MSNKGKKQRKSKANGKPTASKRRRLNKPSADKERRFSHKPKVAASDILNIGKSKKFTLNELATFESEYLPPSKERINETVSEMCKAYRAYGTGVSNESEARSVLNPVFINAVGELKEKSGIDVEWRSEFSITGESKQGAADMAIVSGEAILLAIEVKTTGLEKCVAQNVVQVQAAFQQNRQKGINLGNIMYGMAMTLTESILLEVVFNDDDKGTASKSDTFELLFGDDSASVEPLTKQVDRFLGHTMWCIKNQADKLAIAS
jgi:hypothetical protein